MQVIPLLHAAMVRGAQFIGWGASVSDPSEAEVPLRAELFSIEQMERHGDTLAQQHRLHTGRGDDRLLRRLEANAQVLQHACTVHMAAVHEGRRITPAGEWLLDNFYLIEEQIFTARSHFPKWYSRELPVLAGGPSSGLARVYDIALEVIAHGDGRVDLDNLNRFLAAYQRDSQLKLGELWAIPIMLRLALIENLRRIAARLTQSMEERDRATVWADKMLEVAEQDPKSLILVIADMARSDPVLANAFVAELVRKLQGHSSAQALPLNWIEQNLSESGLTIEQMVQSETQSQAVNQVCISNSIASLRMLQSTDWRDFVEAQSRVEQTLRSDAADVYAGMDFATRDHYRHAVEKMARWCSASESGVAAKAVQLAAQARSARTTTPATLGHAGHVGHYLLGEGRTRLERALQVQLPVQTALQRWLRQRPLPLYLGAIAVLTLAAAALLLYWANRAPAGVDVHDAAWWLMAVLATLACSQLAVGLVNWLSTVLAKPDVLPRMDFSQGIPPAARTLVVVPTMLSSAAGVGKLVEALEVRFLANQDPQLHYALLTDWCDATTETRDDDASLLTLARDGIAALNHKYPGSAPGQDVFFLFHRVRQWNAQEQVWMGYERKRGKLAALNALLRAETPEAGRAYFAEVVGDISVLRQVRYVLTLDTDTQLQRDAARTFAATMEHPLNRPQLDAAHQCINAGYGILQPRMAVSLPSTNRSRYARLMGSEPGVDPYTRAVSDVYQDLFHEGSFIGKGMYDVDAFERMLKQQLPDNRILSHDLLEGCYTRTGLLSDVQLYDDFPARYDADVSRRERWMRGDWQIASWLLPKVPGTAPGQRVRNRLSYLSQWKILDNLRRSLVAPALLGLLLLGWMQAPGVWSLGVLGLLLLVPLISNLHSLVHKPRGMPWPQHAATVLGNLQKQIAQAAMGLVLLPHEAWFSLWAIARTHVRIGISHKRLLEWRASDIGQATADAAPAGSLQDLLQTYARMWMAPALALAAVLWLAFTPGLPGTALPVAMPWLLAWAAAPLLAWWLSQPLAEHAVELNPQQTVFLRQLARRTWHFFERFVTAEEHWLPPDNFQEQPAMALAHRTSPTNMGMALLANATAHDFGYISTGALLQRTAQTLDSMQALERYAGHFYNWYDTQSCQPLHPRYISAVDSGNLSGHLLTLRPALLALADEPVLHARTFEGLLDALGNLRQALGTKPAAAVQQALAHLTQRLQQLCASAPASMHAAMLGLDAVALQVTALQRLLETDTAPAAQSWAQALHAQCVDAQSDLRTLQGEAHGAEHTPIPSLRALAEAGNAMAQARMAQLDALAHQATSLALADFGFLYDTSRDLFVVGYNVDDHRRDSGHYDLLASEARLCSFVAIALGQIPQDNWFALGRLLASTSGGPALLSWSGSMFEYLMPNLVMPVYPNTLLHQTNRAVVQRQIAFGDQQKVPWGISESGYNTVDAGLNYQYRAFGVPGLGLKRGLADDLVIAPYATALALTVLPEAACRNLQRLVGLGMQGDYGLFEAVDYTPARVPRGQISAVVRSYMAHHQGMSLLALSHALLDQAMPKRFAADPLFQATALLLQERASHATVFAAHALELAELRSTHIGQASPLRVLRQPDVAVPEVQLLSNGHYHLLISQAGGGYSRWKGLAVTRWREDATRDAWGAFCYVRDVTSGALWSVTHQPSLQRSEGYEAIFSEGRAEFRRRDEGIDTHTEIVVSPEDAIELRRMRITNRNRSRRTIELTSYAEVVLAPAAADATHPAFSNLFVQTEIVRERQAILCHRRPRSDAEDQVWLFHLMAVHGGDAHSTSYETDRMRFTGRGQNLQFPNVMQSTAPLSDSEGPVLDPIVAIRHVITLEPQQTVMVDAVLGVAESRVQVLGLVDKYRDRHLADRVPDLATTHAWVNLQQINASEANAQLFARLAGSVVYANPALRAPAAVLAQNRRGQSGLWGYGVSGDLPIVLVQVSSPDHMELVRQMVQAHAYWRLKGLVVDLVIWNEDHAGYRQALQDQIMGLIASGIDANFTDRPGGIFVRIAEHMSPEDRTLFQTVARVILVGKNGTLAEQIGRQTNRDARELPGLLLPSLPAPQPGTVLASTAPTDTGLQFFNGLGGFSADGGEYVIHTEVHADGLRKTTPLPWVNVLANARFGTVVSESGSAYTWSENAHEFRYTPWSNDPVGDVSGEAIYLRDEETGAFWSPTPLPCGGVGRHTSRHGFGYSVFAHSQDGIESELTVYVDTEAAMKFCHLTVRNRSLRTRKLSATGYVEWVLGDLSAKSSMHVCTEIDADSGAILARNPYHPEFGDRMAFFDAADATRAAGVSVTGDRREFIGRNGSLAKPQAMRRSGLSNRIGAGMDPCAAIQVPFLLHDGQSFEVTFRLGAAGRRGQDDARSSVLRLRGPDMAQVAHNALAAVRAYWQRTLGTVQVQTPDAALNVLANGWLLYQTLACRLWARTGFYQSGGAFGFRDQLQDSMALVHSEPGLLREHLLRCAARQFVEGDVQHWWHPPQGRGVRTLCSDDYLWLAQATCRYVQATGDNAVLQETAPYLKGRPLHEEEESYYDLPGVSEERESLYQHCVRAIRHGLRFGSHGLPLMGSGDWNDGMNLVGIKGQGESVWLAFFLFDTLQRFSHLARATGDRAFAEECLQQAEQLRAHIDQHAWDGAWYRRAYFDDGQALGSHTNAECQIDSISQSWSVLSGAASPERRAAALDALQQHLVRPDWGLIQLLAPPFNSAATNPGYIKGYLPGVRENGGQYTHAAIWAVMAFAAQGDSQRAWDGFNLINPVRHATDAAGARLYQVEPYVVAADVYAESPHQGRGGWTWYTGSASWMYRLVLESLLGLRLELQTLHFQPCLPDDWRGFKLRYRFGEAVYAIEVSRSAERAAGKMKTLVLDGVVQPDATLRLHDDGLEHAVELRL